MNTGDGDGDGKTANLLLSNCCFQCSPHSLAPLSLTELEFLLRATPFSCRSPPLSCKSRRGTLLHTLTHFGLKLFQRCLEPEGWWQGNTLDTHGRCPPLSTYSFSASWLVAPVGSTVKNRLRMHSRTWYTCCGRRGLQGESPLVRLTTPELGSTWGWYTLWSKVMHWGGGEIGAGVM